MKSADDARAQLLKLCAATLVSAVEGAIILLPFWSRLGIISLD